MFAARIFIRLRCFGRLFWDDALVTFALLLSLMNTITWHIIAEPLFRWGLVASGKIQPSLTLMQDLEKFLVGGFVTMIGFITCVWVIKLAFMVFFHRLVVDIRHLRIQWWATLVYTILSGLACYTTLMPQCQVPPAERVIRNCFNDSALYWNYFSMWFNTAMDISSDCFIMAIPMVILWNIPVPLHKKLALAGIFSLVLFTIIAAVLRSALPLRYNSVTRDPGYPAWMYMWSSIEHNIGSYPNTAGLR
ncbi:hypothetical protein M011DRAFT_502575 [Sporormia fimetaria CBS 119925]|uniref:Rhodopsin domain-containing protein n=1 Tax=Sporormia fimetaria CBS 119925 TaxID=1340428 RepID=A0A6A6V9G9_9PLEO|nr:hypothetical protein M011DRAFT_502575 [Sporormia fimetaria CBS 119925]